MGLMLSIIIFRNAVKEGVFEFQFLVKSEIEVSEICVPSRIMLSTFPEVLFGGFEGGNFFCFSPQGFLRQSRFILFIKIEF